MLVCLLSPTFLEDMTHAFVSPTIPGSARSSLSNTGRSTEFYGRRLSVVCVPSRRALCMTSENASSPLSKDDESNESEVAVQMPEIGAEEMAAPTINTRDDSTLQGELTGLPDPLASMNEKAESQDEEEMFTLESINDDDLSDVVVLEECQPPQFYINAQNIAEARAKFKIHESDTGSPEYQIATLTMRIKYLTNHLRVHPKDHASTRGLLKMVAKRTKLLKYLRSQSQDRFHNIIAGLNIRISQQLRELGE